MSDNSIMVWIMGLVVLFAVFAAEELVTCACASPSNMQGAVIERTYTPSHSSTGTAIGANGKVMTTNSYQAAKYSVIVQLDGGVVALTTDGDRWAKCEKGSLVNLERRQSWTGITVDYSVAP